MAAARVKPGIPRKRAAAPHKPAVHAVPMPMLAMAGTLPSRPDDYAFEFKWDGMRALAAIRRGQLVLRSRTGRDITHQFPELLPLAGAVGRDMVLDGEIVAFDEDGRPDFSLLQPRLGRKGSAGPRNLAAQRPVHFVAFDLLRLGGKTCTGLPYAQRRRLLQGLELEGPTWATSPAHPGAGVAMLETARRLGLEGVVAKRLDSTYLPGQRSAAWLKIHARKRQEFVIGGWSEATGAHKGTFGALLVGFHAGTASRGLTFAGRVGTGFDAQTRKRLTTAMRCLHREASPFVAADPAPDAFVHFVAPRLVAEVEFNGTTRHGLLRQAAFKGLRVDKPARDVVWEQTEPPRPVVA